MLAEPTSSNVTFSFIKMKKENVAELTCFCLSSSRSPHLYLSAPAASRLCSPPRVSSPGGLCFASVPPGSCGKQSQHYVKMQ